MRLLFIYKCNPYVYGLTNTAVTACKSRIRSLQSTCQLSHDLHFCSKKNCVKNILLI